MAQNRRAQIHPWFDMKAFVHFSMKHPKGWEVGAEYYAKVIVVGQTGGQTESGGNSGLVGGAGIVLLLTSPHSPSFITVAHIEDTAKRYIEAIC